MEGGQVKALSVSIDLPAGEAYAYLSVPENFARWASGLGGGLRRAGDEWLVETPEGPARVRFSEPNSYGVLDHAVTLPQGQSVYIPLRVVGTERGCELVLTLFRQPDMSDEKFAADAEWVLRDLHAAKLLLEQNRGQSPISQKESTMKSHITTHPAGVRVQVKYHGEVIADTRDAIALKEGDYPVVYYVPRKDVKMERLARTQHTTYCPHKGHASYYSLAGGPENAVWSYEQPYDGVDAIKERLAFYPNKVDAIDISDA